MCCPQTLHLLPAISMNLTSVLSDAPPKMPELEPERNGAFTGAVWFGLGVVPLIGCDCVLVALLQIVTKEEFLFAHSCRIRSRDHRGRLNSATS
jgi:hypothetical protein